MPYLSKLEQRYKDMYFFEKILVQSKKIGGKSHFALGAQT